MAAKTWVRWHVEFLHDPKRTVMSLAEQGIWSLLVLLAGSSTEQDGRLRVCEGVPYTPETLAAALGLRGQDAEAVGPALEKFRLLRMIEIEDDGTIVLLNYVRRQYEKPSDRPEAVAERVRRHRAKNANNKETTCNANVTPVKRECNAPETRLTEQSIADQIKPDQNIAEAEADTLSLKEGGTGGENFLSVGPVENDSAAAAAAAQVFKRELKRSLTPLENEQLAGWLKESSPELVLEALRRAVLQGKPTFRYIGGILQKWRDAGLRTIQAVTEQDPVFGGQSQKVIAMPSRADPGKKDIDEGIRAALAYMRLTVGDPEGLSRAQVDEFFARNDYGPDVARAVKEKLFGGDPP